MSPLRAPPKRSPDGLCNRPWHSSLAATRSCCISTRTPASNPYDFATDLSEQRNLVTQGPTLSRPETLPIKHLAPASRARASPPPPYETVPPRCLGPRRSFPSRGRGKIAPPSAPQSLPPHRSRRRPLGVAPADGLQPRRVDGPRRRLHRQALQRHVALREQRAGRCAAQAPDLQARRLHRQIRALGRHLLRHGQTRRHRDRQRQDRRRLRLSRQHLP